MIFFNQRYFIVSLSSQQIVLHDLLKTSKICLWLQQHIQTSIQLKHDFRKYCINLNVDLLLCLFSKIQLNSVCSQLCLKLNQTIFTLFILGISSLNVLLLKQALSILSLCMRLVNQYSQYVIEEINFLLSQLCLKLTKTNFT